MKKIFVISILGLLVLSACEEGKPDKEFVFTDLSAYSISALVVDNSNTLWVGSDTGLFKSVSGGYQLVDIENEAPVTALGYESVNNSLWIGTIDGLSKLSIGGGSADSVSVNNLSNPGLNSVYVDSNSEKWFGTKKGITRHIDEIWQKEKFKKNVSGTITNAAFEGLGINSIGSYDGNFFFATNGISLYRTFDWNEEVNAFSGATQWLNPYNGTALSDTMYAVFIDSQGRQWFGGTEGVQFHTGNDPKMDNSAFYDELPDPVVRCIAEDPEGNIWVGTENGIAIFDGVAWTTFSTEMPDKYITSIAFDSSGKVYIGTRKGIFLTTVSSN